MAETSDMATLVLGDTGGVAGSGSSLHWTDWLVILGYFLSVITVSKKILQNTFNPYSMFQVGLVSSFKSKRDSVDGYFLASRSMNWIPVITIGQ